MLEVAITNFIFIKLTLACVDVYFGADGRAFALSGAYIGRLK